VYDLRGILYSGGDVHTGDLKLVCGQIIVLRVFKDFLGPGAKAELVPKLTLH
jgi:hypothetical protein